MTIHGQPLPILHRHEDRDLDTSPGYYLWPFLEARFEHFAETSLRILNRPAPHTKPPGGRNLVTELAAEALQTCQDILDGKLDDLPTEAFYFIGGLNEIRANVGRELKIGPVKP